MITVALEDNVMYTSMRYILDDAVKHKYAAIACPVINMETARAEVAAAYEFKAPLIFVIAPKHLNQHARAELMIPMIKTLAEYSPYPVAACLDHGSDFEDVFYAFRHGFSDIMFDGSILPLAENIARTKEVVKLCHDNDMSVEAEIGHVTVASNLSDDTPIHYTDVDEAKYFVESTGVDSVAIAVGTAHGPYPAGYLPQINTTRIREIKEVVGKTPIALHGASGSSDESIIQAVKAGINKINVGTDIMVACRDYCADKLLREPQVHVMQLMIGMENAAKKMVGHWISLSGSAGMGEHFRSEDRFESLCGHKPQKIFY
jgi:fructose-bisphosphate aldolase class II